MLEAVSAFVFGKGIEERSAEIPKGVYGTCCGTFQQPFELREDQLNRVEVRTVRWQVHHSRAGSSDGLKHSGHFVRREIIHDDDVALSQRWHKLLLDPAQEDGSVDCSANDKRSCQPTAPQRGKEGRRLPVAMRDAGKHSLASRCTSTGPRHIRFGPGFVDEHKPVGIKP